NAIPSPYLRTNTLKLSREDLQVRLRDEGIETEMVNGFTDALKVNHYVNLFKSQSFQEGLFEVQDAGSQCIAPFLQVEPGMRVIDACAGTGGKSLHLATLMKNKGRLISMDVAEWKLEEFKMRARRAGVHNFETKVIESAKTIKRHHNSADRLLLDVPCSGLGVLKRNPDAKWKLKPDYINRLLVVQQQILSDYAWMIKPGGMLVYSTCSVLPSENANQVTTFLSKNSDYFELVEEKSLLPSAGLDGFYMARIKRIG
ncbi:MAG: methyltransferase domain-containing protein, partial [Cyclobacteriaceae bacterium]|nr:methyltransferase domain-containing protein [Cyclobacteriaceae bacterium]